MSIKDFKSFGKINEDALTVNGIDFDVDEALSLLGDNWFTIDGASYKPFEENYGDNSLKLLIRLAESDYLDMNINRSRKIIFKKK